MKLHLFAPRLFVAGAALLASLAFPAIAAASTAYSTADVNMRAGPSTAYPVITTIYAGEPVTIYGCLSGWSWCDTGWEGARGWVRGDYLELVYESRHVYLPTYAVEVGLTVIIFEFNTYWDVHYRDRPWYRERDRWRDYWRDHHREARAEWPRDRRDRREVHEERREDRLDVARDRREDRRDVRRDRREDRPSIRRAGREDRREVRRDRREHRQQVRQERRRDLQREVRRDRPQLRREGRPQRRGGGGDRCRGLGGARCR